MNVPKLSFEQGRRIDSWLDHARLEIVSYQPEEEEERDDQETEIGKWLRRESKPSFLMIAYLLREANKK